MENLYSRLISEDRLLQSAPIPLLEFYHTVFNFYLVVSAEAVQFACIDEFTGVPLGLVVSQAISSSMLIVSFARLARALMLCSLPLYILCLFAAINRKTCICRIKQIMFCSSKNKFHFIRHFRLAYTRLNNTYI